MPGVVPVDVLVNVTVWPRQITVDEAEKFASIRHGGRVTGNDFAIPWQPAALVSVTVMFPPDEPKFTVI